MKLKKFVMHAALAACTFGAATVSSHAQGMGGGGQMSPADRTARQVDNLKTKLNLTDDQVAKVKDIYADRDKKVADIRSSGADMDTVRPKIMDANKASNEKIRAILNDDQKKSFDEMQSQMMMMRGGNRPQQ